MTQPSLINLHPNEYSQEFYYYPFSVKLDRYVGSCNTLHDLCNKVWVPNKTEDLNLGVLSMITGVNESKTLAKHLPCQCKSRFDGRKCGTDQWWNNDKCLCESKNVMYVMKIMFGILLHVIVKMQNIQQVLWMIQRLFAMKLQNYSMKTRKLSPTTKQKLFQQILMKRKKPAKRKIFIF